MPLPTGRKKEIGNTLFKVQGGFAFKSSSYQENGILLVRIGNVGKGKLENKDNVYLDLKFNSTHNNFLLKDADILMGMTGDLGKICKIKEKNLPALLNQRVGRFVPDKIDNSFLYYVLGSDYFQNELTKYFAGGAQANVSPAQIEGIEITLPTALPEQQKIATILSTIDDTIDQTDALIAKYQQMKEGLMEKLFSSGIDIKIGKPHKDFQKTKIGEIPKDWDIEELSNLCEKVVDCKNRTCPFVKKSQYPVIRTSNIKKGKLVRDDMKYTDSESYKIRTSRAIPEAGDIIITREAPLGEVLYIPSGITSVLGQRTMLFRTKNALLSGLFLYYYLLSEKTQRLLDRYGSGSTVKHLKVGELADFLIAFPKDIKEQEYIATTLSTMDEKIQKEQTYRAKLELMKKGLMKDLLSGEVRVRF